MHGLNRKENGARGLSAARKGAAFLLAAGIFAAGFSAAAAEDGRTVDLSAESGTITLTEGGAYTLTGTLDGGRIVVNASKDEKVELILAGAEVISPEGPAVECVQAKDLIITLADGTENRLTDAPPAFDSGENAANGALFSKADVKIRGNGALTVEGKYKHGIVSKDDLKIKSGNLTVTSVSDGLRGKDSVTIEGGSLDIRAGKDGISATNDQKQDKGWIEILGGKIRIHAAGDGIQSETTLTISGGDFEITTEGQSSGQSKSQKGVKTKIMLRISGGTFVMNTRDDAFNSGLDAVVDGGDFRIETSDDGLHVNRELTVNGGSFDIPVCYEGFEGTSVTINGGDIRIVSADDAIGAAAGTEEAAAFYSRDGNPEVSVTINGGEIEAVSGGDTVDSNGNIFVNGGKLRLSSPAQPYYEGVLLCNGRVTVTGGDLAMVGNIGVELTVENQPMLLVSFRQDQPEGSEVSLRDQSGNVLMRTTARRNFTQAIFSGAELQEGETYALYIGEEKITDAPISGPISKVAADGGEFTGGYPRGHW